MRILAPILVIIIFAFMAAFHGCCPTKEKVLNQIITEYQNKYVLEYDTIYTPYISRDTLLSTDSIFVDKPIIIEREKLRIEIRRIKGDTIRIAGECKPDTVVQEKKIISVMPAKETGTRWWQYIAYVLAGVGALTILGGLLRIITK
jgi:hypothetical protein